LQASATDSDGTLSKVEFFRNGATSIGVGTLVSGKYTFNWTNAAIGSHSVTAVATDNRGATATSGASGVTVCAATVTVTAPVTNTVLNLATPIATLSTTLSATASYPAACGTVGKVEFYNGATPLGLGTLAGATYSLAWNNVPPGTYTLKARAYRGASSAFTESSTVSLVVNKPPSITLDTPAAGAIFTAPATVLLSATASDTDGTISTVEFLQGATVVATGALNAGKYTATWSNVGAGSYALTARAKDNRNAIGTSTPASSVTVSTACLAPAVNWSAPVSGAVINTPSANTTTASVTLSATASTTAGCAAVGKVEFYNGTTLLGVGTLVAGNYSYVWNNVAAGTYNVKARAYLGNTTTSTDSALSALVVNRPPSVTIDAPPMFTEFVAPTTIALSASASDADGSIDKVEFFSGAALVATGVLSAGKYAATWSNVAAGAYTVIARATDNRGSVSTSQYALDVAAPLPDVAFSKPTRQSSTFGAAVSKFAVDGSPTSSAITETEDSPWWEVDLGQGYNVSTIEITPTISSSLTVLSDLLIVLSATPIAPLSGEQLNLQQNFADTASSSDAFQFTVTNPTGPPPYKLEVTDPRGCCSASAPRYVRIWSRAMNAQLNLAQVRVLGRLPFTNWGPYAGARLAGVEDGSTLVGTNTLQLSAVAARTNADNSTNPAASSAVNSVEYFNGDTSLGVASSSPFTLSYTPSLTDHRFRARVSWIDGVAAWSNDVQVRFQTALDTGLRIASPVHGGNAYAGDEGIPGYFTLHGSWTPSANARLEYRLECVPVCATPEPWRVIRQTNGSTFVALVAMPSPLPARARLSVRTMVSGVPTAEAVSEFAASNIKADITGPNFVDGTGQTLQGRIVGLSRHAPQSRPSVFMEQVYYRDGAVYETPLVSANPSGQYWYSTSSAPSTQPELYRQFYGVYSSAGATYGGSGNRFSFATAGVGFTPTFGEKGASINAASIPWSGGPRGWFRVYARGAIQVPGYKSFEADRGSGAVLRYGAAAPFLRSPDGDDIIWQSPTAPISIRFIDYDDSRTPAPASVRWMENGNVVVSADKCEVDHVYLTTVALEHNFLCSGVWTSPALGDHTITSRITDAQGLTTEGPARVVRVLPWSVSFSLPANGGTSATGYQLRFDANVTFTNISGNPARTTAELLVDGVVVQTKTATTSGLLQLSTSAKAGAHTYQLITYNPSGYPTLSNLVTVTGITGTPPSVSIASPAPLTSFVAPAAIAITVDASTPSGSVQRVVVRANGNVIATLLNAPFIYQWSGVPVGTYALTAEATNSAGISSTTLTAVTVTVTSTPPAPPSVAVTLPSRTAGFSVSNVNDGIACVTVTARSVDANLIEHKVTFNGAVASQIPQPSAVSDIDYPFCLPYGTPPGTYPLYARVKTTGQQSYDSAVIQVVVRAMQISLTRPPELGYLAASRPVYEGDTVVFEAVASGSASSIARIEYLESLQALNSPTPLVTVNTAPWRGTWVSTLRSGLRYFAACAYDTDSVRACATSSQSTTLLPASKRNRIVLMGPSVAAQGTNTFSVTPTMGTASSGAALAISTIALFDADTREKIAEKNASPFVFNITFPQSRRLISALVDGDGNEVVSNILSVTSNNQSPIAQIVAPIDGSEFPAGTTITVKANATDLDGTVSRLELWAKSESGGVDTLIVSGATANLTTQLALPAATQRIRLYARVFDNSGANITTPVTTVIARSDITDPRYFVWTNFNAALKAGNKQIAMSYLTPTAQENYTDTLDAIIPNMAAIAASYSPLAGIEITTETADYLVTRLINGQRVVFVLRFVLMDDGTWKLESM
jgi:Bacterial Ig domain